MQYFSFKLTTKRISTKICFIILHNDFHAPKKLQNFNDAKFNGNDGNNISAMKLFWKLLRKANSTEKKSWGDIFGMGSEKQ